MQFPKHTQQTKSRVSVARLRLPVLVLILTVALVSVGCARKVQELRVQDAWVRLSPPNSMMTAGYGTFTNTGSEELIFSSFTSPQFGDVTLHYTEDVNGTATMREASNHRLAPGESLELKPGGFHLMLMQRVEPTPEGTDIEIAFEFASGSSAVHSFTVTRR